ncbi:exopolysaccharide biosynthesis protein [Minwuia sp.]|uniref:exopolysaccharide biosynthesis protein n=1 Tax=Minwuia sp. TaxID=2493630 RepID=UPI003A923054
MTDDHDNETRTDDRAGSNSLTDLLDQIDRQAEDGSTTIGAIMDALDSRSFAPLLLVPGLIALGPTGAIPGMSIATGSIILLVSVQILFGRDNPWLPQKVLDFEVSADRLEKLVGYSRSPAGFLDRYLKKRLTVFTDGPGGRLGALMCALMALTMYPLALLPFGVSLPAGSVTAYAMGLATRDGVPVLLANLLGLGALGLAVQVLTGWI